MFMRCPMFQPRLTSVLVLAATLFTATPRAIAQQETVLYNFNPAIREGIGPQSSLIFDAFGNLYGTTYIGGVNSCNGMSFYCGTVFELSPAQDGWTEKVIHNFGNGADGANSSAAVIFDASGNLYGTTAYGGAYGYGTVFELSPNANGSWSEKVLHHFNFDGRDGFNPTAALILDGSGNLYGTTPGGGE